MIKNIHNDKKQQSYKTIKIDQKTHTALQIYKATNRLKRLGDAVRDLLDKAQK